MLQMLELINVCDIATVDGKIWAVFTIGLDIYIIKTTDDGSWSTPYKVIQGQHPTLSYENPQAYLYFENGAKIQRLEMLPGELGLPVSPLQLWDAIDPRFKGVTVYIEPSRLMYKGLQYRSVTDDWPDFQPKPVNPVAEGYRLYWTAAPQYNGVKVWYKVYEEDVLIGETTNTWLDWRVKAYAKYSFTTVYTILEITTESRKEEINTPFLVSVEDTLDAFLAGYTNRKLVRLSSEPIQFFITDTANFLEAHPRSIVSKVRPVANYECIIETVVENINAVAVAGYSARRLTIYSMEAKVIV
jgi:hypothetical protein